MSAEDAKHPGEGWLAILDALRSIESNAPAPEETDAEA